MIKAIVFDCLGVLGNHSAAGWNRHEALLEFIQDLKARYKIGMLSNLDAAGVDSLFPRQEREELFDATVIAEEVGMVKPQPEMYRAICKRLGVEPHEAVFVDDYSGNARGAEAIGMRGVVYTNLAAFKRELAGILQEPYPNA